ncbi:MAG: N-acetyl-gamma-glutamyl-phosphate reductase [Candidatus Omnitrophica bacterium]|nr:N-acetyl-gamma-glutamyl-phosphate reductase [Candidatus Omnitrophota bacterium]MBU1996676.1 N-acetyl-gamma-glutamyl-phosphate reductase [Candidatus Omnitrophota bacterium]MBU4333783.1 N-acetyl-gamma-glutamyl-phosphate reductase [Candidatus Omnitrophota bacterium]
MIRAGIVGISGYSGFTALDLLLKHPNIIVKYVSANNTTGKISDIWPKLSGRTNLVCDKFDLKKAVELCDVIFLAVPHTISMKIVPDLLTAKKTVIDLSGDYRLSTSSAYEKWYGTPHVDVKNLKKAVYGLPEIYRASIKKSKFISNPGCFPTAALLGLAPISSIFSDLIDSIIIDAKSGVSGAGKKASVALNYSETNENFKAYKVLNHQHGPEIDKYLSKFANKNMSVDFVPHLLPCTRGILETIYVRLNNKLSLNTLHKIYKRFYKTEPFVRIADIGQQPELKNVTGTNYCDIGLSISKDNRLVVITSVIDNLVKGASGQAIQNMNIICGFNETLGLI